MERAKGGVIRNGHQGIYDVIERLRASAAKLDGAARRKVLFKCSEVCQALDAKVEAFVSGVQDPSVEDRAAIYEGVYNLLRDCLPFYHALKSEGSLTEACDEFNAAEATLARVADADEAYGEYRKLHGGTVCDAHTGKYVKLNAKEFAKWQATLKKANEKFAKSPYEHTNQTTDKDEKAFSKKTKREKNLSDKYTRRTKKARKEQNAPTPRELQMKVMAGGEKKYRVSYHIYRFAPAGSSNPYTTMEAAMELAALCLANRPAGMGREAKQAARAQKGLPDGVSPEGGGFQVQLMPKKKTVVKLAAPGGGFVFGTAAAASKAIKDYEDAGSPTEESHSLVFSVYRK